MGLDWLTVSALYPVAFTEVTGRVQCNAVLFITMSIVQFDWCARGYMYMYIGY